MATDDETDDWQTEAKERYKLCLRHWSEWRDEARQCYEYYAGHQWTEEDRAHLSKQMRPAITFNRIAPLVDAVLGHEANNRTEVQYIPRQLGDAKVAELITQASDYFRDACDAEHEESDAFRDAIVAGVGCTSNRLDDTKNPEYDLIKERVDPLEILIDPSSKKPNFDDRRYLFRSKRFPRAEVKQRWPDADLDAGDWEGGDESEPTDATPRNAYRNTGENADDKGILVVEYQWLDTTTEHVVTNPATGESKVISADDWKEASKTVQDAGIPHAERRVNVIRRAFFVGDTAVQVDVVCPKHWTYNFITGKRDRKSGMWFGIVRSLIDPQQWANKWLSQMLHIVNSNAKGGVMVERSAADPVELESKWSDPAGIVYFNDGALKDNRVLPKPPPQWPAGVDKLLEQAVMAFGAVSGVNAELLGMADREQPGVLEYQRKQSAVTLLAPLFDSLKRYRKEDGRCWLYLMQEYMSDGRIIRITVDQSQMQQQQVPGQPPPAAEQYVPFWKDPNVAEYDVIVDQSSSAPNQKEATWSVLMSLGPVLQEVIAGNPQVLLALLEYSPMPESLIEKLKGIAAQASQQQQMSPEMQKAQAEIQANQAKMQAQMQLEQTKAAADIQIKQQQAQADMQLEQQKVQGQMEIERAKAVSQAQVQIEGQRMKMGMQQQAGAMQMEHDAMTADREQQRLDYEARRQAEIDHLKSMVENVLKVMSAPVVLEKGKNGQKTARRVMQ